MPELTPDDLAPGSSAQGFVPTLTANQLRYLGEKADGLRDKPLSMVIVGGTVDVIATDQVGSKTKVLLNLETLPEGKGVPGDAKIEIRWHGKVSGPGTELDKADAVFVTQSAIEKFLLPYYLRFKSPAEVQALKNKLFSKESVGAAFHIPPSITAAFPGQALTALADKPESDVGSVGWVGMVSSTPESANLATERCDPNELRDLAT